MFSCEFTAGGGGVIHSSQYEVKYEEEEKILSGHDTR